MAIAADRVKDTTVNPSNTATITLDNSAPIGFRTFGSSFTVGDRVMYAIFSDTGADWEVGYGILVTSTTLLRDNITANSDDTFVPITFPAGTYNVINTITADRHTNLMTRGKTIAVSTGLSVAI